ncbi:sigma-70 family RNA polymerase sigma factor [Candidatus Poribacteria bacterium]|nr:sigma-70 family RNA polymerase sigma factor [Candidatus Poribacteria bacterium]
MEKDDVQLIHRILSGDDEAFSTLVKKYQKSVHALAWRKIGDFHYAEEITQDVFIQAYKKLSTLKDYNQFAGWLYVVANRICFDWLRKQKPAEQSLEDESMKTVDKLTYESYTLEQQEIEASDRRKRIVRKLLERLPESERTVVTLYYLGEMTTKEIGRFLGVSVNTITSRLQRARERLKASDELLINDTLGGIPLSNNVIENIMREVANIKTVPTPTAKPFVPWTAFGTAIVLVILLISVSNEFLTRFQEPYSFEATSEPTIEIIDSITVIETDAKRTVRNQIGKTDTQGEGNSEGSRVSDDIVVPNTSTVLPMVSASDDAPKLTRFTLSNGIRVVNLYVENSSDVGIFSYLPLGLVTDGKAKPQWSQLVNRLTVKSAGPIDYKTSGAETMTDNMRIDFIGSPDTWMQGVDKHAKWLSGLPFSEDVLTEEVPNVLSQIDYVEKNLASHKFSHTAWNQVFRHGETDIEIRESIKSAKLDELQEYRDLHLLQADRVLLCVIGGVDIEILKQTLERQLGSINIPENRLPEATVSPVIGKDQNATWDINVTHYIETYPIPRPEDKDYPALFVASGLIQFAIGKDEQLKEQTGYVVSGIDLATPEQIYYYVNASLKPETDLEKVKERIRQLTNQLRQPENNRQVAMVTNYLSQELSAPPDMKTLMQNKPENVPESMWLLQLGVSWGMLEYKYGETMSQLAKAIANVSTDDVASVVNRYFTEDRRMTLVLSPKASE